MTLPTASGSASTAERILAAAEQLFAEQGIDAVSLREVNAASGTRNASAVQYHFRNKEGVLRAIIAGHMEVVDTRRVALLDAIERSGRLRSSGLRPVIEALVLPLAEELGNQSGRNYLQITAQMIDRPPNRDVAITDLRMNEGLRRCADLILTEMGGIPADVGRERQRHLLGFCVRALADQARTKHRKGDALFVANLVDMITAAAAAPVSAATRAEIKK